MASLPNAPGGVLQDHLKVYTRSRKATNFFRNGQIPMERKEVAEVD